MSRDPTTLVLGRGEVYFDRFAPGTRVGDGEVYIGNTPSFVVGREIERLERFTAYKGQKLKGESAFVGETNTITFTTDNMEPANVALWYGQNDDITAIEGIGPVTESFTIKVGRYYQLGQRFVGFGARYVENVVVSRTDIVIPAAGNYELDKPSGRIRILPTGVFEDGNLIEVDFEWRATTSDLQSPRPKEQFGSLRFIGTPAVGPTRNHYYPFVRLTANGTMDLKGDQWQQISFTADALKLRPSLEVAYVQHLQSVFYTADESGILDFGGITLDEFPPLEDVLDFTVNTQIPSHDYHV